MRKVSAGAMSMMLVALTFAPASAGQRSFVKGPMTKACAERFTVRQVERVAVRTYRGTKRVALRKLRRLGYMERCQRNPQARGFVRRFDHHRAELQRRRRWAASHPWSYATASWYYDTNGRCASPAGCSYYGVANLSLSFGTRVEFSYGGRTVWAVVDDRGPYVGGRLWDLDEHVAAALGFAGVGSVGYRLQR